VRINHGTPTVTSIGGRVGAGLAAAVAAFSCAAAHADIDIAANYQLRCATCHGSKGEGTDQKAQTLGPALKGNPFVINAPASALIKTIRSGRAGPSRLYDKGYPNMPSFGFELVPDVDALVKYLKTTLQETEK